jgi:hypothetical protein
MEYISKLIKNNKKHFGKDENEDVYANLKICKILSIYNIFSFVTIIGGEVGLINGRRKW